VTRRKTFDPASVPLDFWRRDDVRLALARCDNAVLDEAVCALSRLLMNQPCEVDHGPMGIGIEIMTYIADHYRPPALRAAVGLFGRPNVVRCADFVIFIGGGPGTLDEVDLAISMGKRIVPFAASGGAARHAFERMAADVSLRGWMPEATFAALGCCASASEYASVLEQVLAETRSAP
jgi:SLOG cluster4 family